MKLFGILGLLVITVGVLMRGRKKQDYAYICGGILLEIYSVYIGDIIFIVLQAIFTVAAVYNLLRLKKQK